MTTRLIQPELIFKTNNLPRESGFRPGFCTGLSLLQGFNIDFKNENLHYTNFYKKKSNILIIKLVS